MTKDSKVRTLVGLAVAAFVVGTVAIGAVYAQQPGPGRRGMMGGGMMMGRGMMDGGPLGMMHRGLARLGLSDAQKEQVKGIVQGHRDEMKGLAERLRQARRGIADTIANDGDEAAIRAKSAELAGAQADLAVLGAKVRKEVLAVLTPEQQAKAKSFRLGARERVDRLIDACTRRAVRATATRHRWPAPSEAPG